jgi:type IV pilus biogenesis/stability protein PilW
MVAKAAGSTGFQMRRAGLIVVVLATAVGSFACAHGPSKKDREGAEIHYQLGAEALRAGRRGDAIQEFDRAIQLDERHPTAHLGRGITLQLFGKLPEAEQEYRRALELRPDFPDARNGLGQLLASTGRLEEAVREFDLALEDMTYREAYVARCNKGMALYRLGRRDEGIGQLQTCVSLAPRYCQGHRELGRIQLDAGRLKEALESLGRYAELCEKVPDAWYQLALARMRAGDPDRAREAFQKCESVAGEDPLADECRRKVQALQ